jgi:hypothetical protein
MTEVVVEPDRAQVAGILCGAGALPLRVAQAMRARGYRVVAVGIEREAAPEIADVADEVTWTGLARLGQWIRVFKEARCSVVMMCGGIEKARMFGNKAALFPDLRTVKFWGSRLASREDHTILGALADEFEKEGLIVGSIPQYCPDLLIPQGCLTRRRPGKKQWKDVIFGWGIAKHIAAAQIGQCVVVKERAVVAVEGIDGTDATLKRGGELAGGGAGAVKVPKEDHDIRFDIPCIGPDTVDVLHDAHVEVLAVEAQGTILIDADVVRDKADGAGVAIVAVTPEEIAQAGA